MQRYSRSSLLFCVIAKNICACEIVEKSPAPALRADLFLWIN